MYFVMIAPMPGWTRYTMVNQFVSHIAAQKWIMDQSDDDATYVIAGILP